MKGARSMFKIKAYAEGGGYNAAVARQLAREAGTSQAAARRTIMDNAGGRTPFQNARGRNSTNTNVRRNSIRSARRNQRTRGRRA